MLIRNWGSQYLNPSQVIPKLLFYFLSPLEVACGEKEAVWIWAEVCCWLQGLRRGLRGGDLWLGHPHCRGGTWSRPATGVPPQCQPGSCRGHRGWGTACIRWRPELPTAGIPEEFLRLVLIFWRSALIDFFFFFFAFMAFSPSPKKVIIQILFKMLFALKLLLYSFFLVKKGSLRTNQSGKYSVFSHCYLLFSISFFFKTQLSEGRIVEINFTHQNEQEKNKSKNLKTGFVHLKDTHRIFVPCLTGSQQKQHLFEVLIWALAFSH